jgi:hypothetical protein
MFCRERISRQRATRTPLRASSALLECTRTHWEQMTGLTARRVVLVRTLQSQDQVHATAAQLVFPHPRQDRHRVDDGAFDFRDSINLKA